MSNIKHLGIGEVYTTKEPSKISTVLGCCVAVCIWDIKKKYGGMNHFMCPSYHEEACIPEMKFGDKSIPHLIQSMLKLGSDIKDLKCSIAGGGDILNLQHSIGERNKDIAIKLLKDYNIPIVSQDVGGKNSRKVSFYNETGEVQIETYGSLRDEG